MTTNKKLVYLLSIVLMWEWIFLTNIAMHQHWGVTLCCGMAFLLNIPAPAIVLWKAKLRAL